MNGIWDETRNSKLEINKKDHSFLIFIQGKGIYHRKLRRLEGKILCLEICDKKSGRYHIVYKHATEWMIHSGRRVQWGRSEALR